MCGMSGACIHTVHNLTDYYVVMSSNYCMVGMSSLFENIPPKKKVLVTYTKGNRRNKRFTYNKPNNEGSLSTSTEESRTYANPVDARKDSQETAEITTRELLGKRALSTEYLSNGYSKMKLSETMKGQEESDTSVGLMLDSEISSPPTKKVRLLPTSIKTRSASNSDTVNFPEDSGDVNFGVRLPKRRISAPSNTKISSKSKIVSKPPPSNSPEIGSRRTSKSMNSQPSSSSNVESSNVDLETQTSPNSRKTRLSNLLNEPVNVTLSDSTASTQRLSPRRQSSTLRKLSSSTSHSMEEIFMTDLGDADNLEILNAPRQLRSHTSATRTSMTQSSHAYAQKNLSESVPQLKSKNVSASEITAAVTSISPNKKTLKDAKIWQTFYEPDKEKVDLATRMNLKAIPSQSQSQIESQSKSPLSSTGSLKSASNILASSRVARSKSDLPNIPSQSRNDKHTGSYSPKYPSSNILDKDPSPELPLSLVSSSEPRNYIPQTLTEVRITYGRSRSMLGQSQVTASKPDYLFDSFNNTDTWMGKERDLESSDDEASPGKVKKFTKKVKSAHELREQGEFKRIKDEMDYLLEGLEGSIDAIRAGCVDIARKLLDSEFTKKVRAHGFIGKMFQPIRHQDDRLVQAGLLAILTILLRDKRNHGFLVSEEGFTDALVAILVSSKEKDMLKLKGERGLKKEERGLIEDIRHILETQEMDSPERPITCLHLSIDTLALALSTRSRYEELMKEKLQITGGLEIVSEIFIEGVEKVDDILRDYEIKGTIIKPTGIDYPLLENCLKILEFSTNQHVINQKLVAKNVTLLDNLVKFLMICEVESYNHKDQNAPMDCLLETLRVLINLTNDHPTSCKLISTAPYMGFLLRIATAGYRQQQQQQQQKDEQKQIIMAKMPMGGNKESNIGMDTEDEAVKFDALLLTIGLMINMMEADEGSREEMRRVEQSLNCPGEANCLKNCTCIDRQSGVSWLVDMYNLHQTKSMNESQMENNVLTAYLSLLIGCLMKSNRANERLILDRLPNNSVAPLIHNLQTFVQFTEIVASDTGAIEDDLFGNQDMHIDAMAALDEHKQTGSINEGLEDVNEFGKSTVESFNEIVKVLEEIEERNCGSIPS